LGFATKETAYRSRVCFGDFEAEGQPKEMPPVRVVLQNPKPSFFPAYTVDGRHYNEGFALRGRKRYWLKKATPVASEKANVDSTLKPLAEGTVFKGVIRFKNLHEDELGLLLWCLQLEKGCFQSVGMGKPYGYGRMALTITDLYTMDMKQLYDDGLFCNGGYKRENPSAYIACYDAYAVEKLPIINQESKPSVRNRSAVKDFFFMCRTLRDPATVGYMTLSEHSNCWVLPSVADIRTQKHGQTPTEKKQWR